MVCPPRVANKHIGRLVVEEIVTSFGVSEAILIKTIICKISEIEKLDHYYSHPQCYLRS